jgi:hypothetical protein
MSLKNLKNFAKKYIRRIRQMEFENQQNQESKVKLKDSAQRLGEDLAYTFKGLYKMHDYLKFEYESLIIGSFIVGVYLISDIKIFGIEFIVNKVLSIVSVCIAGYMLFKKQEYEKIQGYALLANNIKNLYDIIEKKYLNNEELDDSIYEQARELKAKTDVYNISGKSYIKVKDTIDDEMDLEWIYGIGYNRK